MAKELTLGDALTKLSNIFKADMLVIDHHICIGGDKTEDKTVGCSITILGEKFMNIFKTEFPENDLIFFTDVKKAKASLSDFMETEIDEKMKNEILNRKDFITNLIRKTETWDTFDFSDEELSILYDEAGTIELFKDNDKIPSVTVSKSCFPMLTKNTINSVVYTTFKEKEHDMMLLLLCYDIDQFQVYSLIRFLIL